MLLADAPIDWTAPAHLKEMEMPPNRSFAWVGDNVHYGTIASVVRTFRSLPPENQRHV